MALILGVSICLSAGANSSRKKEGSSVKSSERKPNQDINYSVFSEDYPKEQLSGTTDAEESAILNPAERERILATTNLHRFTKGWDHLEKDILILRASKNSLPMLQQKYPKLPGAQLQQLQNLLRSGK